ncbi:cation:proton antiporter domain-containing protein [Nevskia soli]|uniref:cation:proton antiporter domain-containing protein n=1 Tax=Nevskia soli TaxID=418856 RepID=UPI000A68303C|nr:cation:proton antiporter [Nevskia soli]
MHPAEAAHGEGVLLATLLQLIVIVLVARGGTLLGLDSFSDWSWCALIVLVAGAAKIVPVYFAARAAGMRNEDAAACGVLMNTRALMELVVLNIGLDLGFIPPKVFTLLVIMAVATTLVTAPLLRLRYRRSGRLLVIATEA